MEKLTSKAFATETYNKIDDTQTFDDPNYYGTIGTNPDDYGTAHLSVLDGDGLAVSLTTTINY